MKNKILLIYSWMIRSMFYFVPDVPFTMRIRGWFYGLAMIKCGKNLQVTNNAYLKGLQNFKIGNDIFIGNNTIVMGSGKLVIEDEVMIAPGCVIVMGNHTAIENSFRFGPIDKGVIVIKKGCWVGANTTLVINSTLPRGSVLGANSFLNKKFEDEGCLYAGVPAKFIKKL